MAAPPLLTLKDIAWRLGARQILAGAELTVAPGARIALVGRNGAGKSTLMRIAAGTVEADAGLRFLQPGARLVHLLQEPVFPPEATALGIAAEGLPADRAGAVHEAEAHLDALGIAPDRLIGTMSGGEARRVALARALAGDPDLLLLDEPTNHLDLTAIEWLEETLARLRAAQVIISHDRRFLARLTRTTLWLDRGQVRRLDEGFGAFEDWRDRILAEEAEAAHKAERLILRETKWLREGLSARRRRNMGRVRRLMDLRRERTEALKALGTVGAAGITTAERSGRIVIEAEGATKRWGERVILRPFDLTVLRGDRIGIVGPNGAGKSTLVGVLTGRLAPDGGTVTLGANVQVELLDQGRSALTPGATARSVLCPAGGDQVQVGGRPRHLMGFLEEFLFDPAQADQPLEALSGGERNRLLLARAMTRPANLLVLDEPTNDLDIETLDILEEWLADYAGTVLLVSHDRDFLDRVATVTLVLEGDGRVEAYPGGYSDAVAQHGPIGRRTTVASAPPAPTTPRAPAPVRRAPTRRLSYKDQRALDELPARLEALAARISKEEAVLADPDLYRRSPERFAAATAALETARRDLAAAEESWLELEMKREALAEGGS